MNDRRFLPVGGSERVGDAGDDVDGLLPREPPSGDERLTQRLPVEVLEHHDELSRDLGAGEATDDVRMLELGKDLHLVQEKTAALLALSELLMKDFQRNPPLR